MITIGLPVYNAENTLKDTLRSIYSQTVNDWELIIVDDSSTDRSLQMVEAVSAADSRVRVLRNNQNLGLPVCLNRIASEARGEYIARMDADDLMHPHRLQKQLEVLDSQSDVDVVQTGMCILDKDLNPIAIRSKSSLDTRPAVVLKHGLLFHATIMGHTTWFLKNPYDESLRRVQDYELWCRTCKTSVFATLPEPLYLCREVGMITLKKYLVALEIQRKIYRSYGPPEIGELGTLELVIRSYLKGAVFAGFSFFGKTDYLVRQRSQPLSNQQRLDALEALQIISQTPVPGLA